MRIALSVVMLFAMGFGTIDAQNVQQPAGGGQADVNAQQCLSVEQSDEIITALKASLKTLELDEVPTSRSIVKFIWPVRKAAGFDDPGYLGISNYVDHNEDFSGTHNNDTRDYDCGRRSYDTGSGYNHRGVDIFTWPFSWQKMDEDLVEVIAAATGTIILKADGHFDRSCEFCTTCSWNAIYVRHNDGSVAWYGHLKRNSLTEKGIGDTVEAGEYLGIVGSSGNSTGPHLHFEVWRDGSFTSLVDPYAGVCNTLNNDSWWEDQPDYWESGINKISIGNNPPVPGGCGQQWNRNEWDQFETGEIVYIGGYFRDQRSGTSATYNLKRPDGTILNSWNQLFNATFTASWWWFQRVIPAFEMEGSWSVEVEYADKSEEVFFQVGQVTSTKSIDENLIRISPNPFNEEVIIRLENFEILETTLYNILGEVVESTKMVESNGQIRLLTSDLPKGVFFLIGKTKTGEHFRKKLLKL